MDDNIQENQDCDLLDCDRVSSIGMKCSLLQLDHGTANTGDHIRHTSLLFYRRRNSRWSMMQHSGVPACNWHKLYKGQLTALHNLNTENGRVGIPAQTNNKVTLIINNLIRHHVI